MWALSCHHESPSTVKTCKRGSQIGPFGPKFPFLGGSIFFEPWSGVVGTSIHKNANANEAVAMCKNVGTDGAHHVLGCSATYPLHPHPHTPYTPPTLNVHRTPRCHMRIHVLVGMLFKDLDQICC
jgi:hypothetical protein